MTQIEWTENQQNIPAIVSSEWSNYISPDLLIYASETWDKVLNLLDWVWWHSNYYWRKLSVLPIWRKVDDIIEYYHIPKQEELW